MTQTQRDEQSETLEPSHTLGCSTEQGGSGVPGPSAMRRKLTCITCLQNFPARNCFWPISEIVAAVKSHQSLRVNRTNNDKTDTNLATPEQSSFNIEP